MTIPPPSPAEPGRLEAMAYAHGLTSDAYLAVEPWRQTFWGSHGGAIAYARVGPYLKAVGSLLAPVGERDQLLAEFLDTVHTRRQTISFFNVIPGEVDRFRRQGFTVVKWGEEALLDLPGWTPAGSACAWLRRQRRHVARHDVVAEELTADRLTAPVRRELAEVCAASLRLKPQWADMRFFEGLPEFDRPGRRRIFVARRESGAGRIDAVVVANPYSDGKGWGLELYRHRPDAIRGAVPSTMLFAIDRFREEGVRQVSLCLSPGRGCGTVDETGDWLAHQAMRLGSSRFNVMFDPHGLYHFKSRFRPRFEPRYVCVWPRVTLGSLLSTGWLWGIWKVSPWRLGRVIARRLQAASARRSLERLGTAARH
ncbi:DUF2156 domain-containing protein [Planctellipticum variicoloris]|uniref:DUF2156 domain-containing protein n=1 Tax=Planctellipticum variicoloris TaxID=3064265 RepID=UPI003013A534|nr:DUF2156 domain-containing protein [Planctomycetaceae bacterium SH412]